MLGQVIFQSFGKKLATWHRALLRQALCSFKNQVGNRNRYFHFHTVSLKYESCSATPKLRLRTPNAGDWYYGNVLPFTLLILGICEFKIKCYDDRTDHFVPE